METITSRQNPAVVDAIKLRDKKHRDESGSFFFEGKKLFDEAVSRNAPLTLVFACGDEAGVCSDALFAAGRDDVRVFSVNDSVMEKLSTEKSPQGVFCICKAIDKFHEFATIYNKNVMRAPVRRFIVSSLRDPGNLGTIIRSCAAFGVDELILSSDCADIYNPKTVRASMGTLFDSKITVVDDLVSSIASLVSQGIRVYAAALDDTANTLQNVDNPQDACFVIGNEGHGLSEEVILACTSRVFIPMSRRAESLNASVAASVILWECARNADNSPGK